SWRRAGHGRTGRRRSNWSLTTSGALTPRPPGTIPSTSVLVLIRAPGPDSGLPWHAYGATLRRYSRPLFSCGKLDQPEVARFLGDGEHGPVRGEREGVPGDLGAGELRPELRRAGRPGRGAHREAADAALVPDEVDELAVGRPGGGALVPRVGGEPARVPAFRGGHPEVPATRTDLLVDQEAAVRGPVGATGARAGTVQLLDVPGRPGVRVDGGDAQPFAHVFGAEHGHQTLAVGRPVGVVGRGEALGLARQQGVQVAAVVTRRVEVFPLLPDQREDDPAAVRREARVFLVAAAGGQARWGGPWPRG